MPIAKGAGVHGEFGSADASALTEANSRIVLYPYDSVSAVTLASTDWLFVTDLLVSVGAALTVQVYSGADATVDAGELVAKLAFAAAGSQHVRLYTPAVCRRGTWPKVKTSGAGQVDVTLYGSLSSIL